MSHLVTDPRNEDCDWLRTSFRACAGKPSSRSGTYPQHYFVATPIRPGDRTTLVDPYKLTNTDQPISALREAPPAYGASDGASSHHTYDITKAKYRAPDVKESTVVS
jgi:hypothetical protein